MLNLSLGEFYGIDSAIEFLIIIVSLVISYYSHKIEKVVNNINYKLLSRGFLCIAIAFVFKIAANLTILYDINLGEINLIQSVVSPSNFMSLIHSLSFIFYQSFSMIGFLLLFFMSTNTERIEKIFLFIYLGLITVLFSLYFSFVFYITLSIILITLTLHFYRNYSRKKSQNTFMVFIAFFVILVANIFFIFLTVHFIFYLIGEFLLLIGFLFLLLNQSYLKIKHEKKKDKTRSS